MYSHPQPATTLGPEPRETPDIDVLDAAVGLEMRGLVDETTRQRFGRHVLEIARERVAQGLTFSADPSLWSTRRYRGLRGWAERRLPALNRFAEGFLFGAGTLLVFVLLWFSDLSQRITPAGGVVVAASVYLASAGWSRLMSVAAGRVSHYSRVEAGRQLARYAARAALTLALLLGVIGLGYLASDHLTAALGPGPMVLATIANLTLFWLALAYAVAEQRPWLVLGLAAAGLLAYAAASGAADLSAGARMQLALAAFNLAGVAYVGVRALLARRAPRSPAQEPGALLPTRRRRLLGALGIGYGFLILSDFVVLAALGYFDATRHGHETYLVLKLVAIIPLMFSLGFMEVIEHRLDETIRQHEQRAGSPGPWFTGRIRRAFALSVLSFGTLHLALSLAAAALLLPGMPLRGLVAESALTADILAPGLLGTLGIAFALGGMFCATLLSSLGEDGIILRWLLVGLALSLGLGAALYPALGILGAAIGFAGGTAAFLALGARTVAARMNCYPLLTYRQAIG